MSIRGRLTGALLLTLALAPLPSRAGGIRGTEIERILQQIGAAQKQIETLEASFRQEKTLGLLAAPEISTGRFVYSKPNRALWTYDTPKRLEMLVSDGWMTTWYPDLRKAERVEIKRFEERIFRYLGAASGAISELESYFHVRLVPDASGAAHVLELTPKSARLGKRVRRMSVWIDRQSHLTTALEYVEGDGDATRYEFFDVRVNRPLPRRALELSLPSSVTVETLAAGAK